MSPSRRDAFVRSEELLPLAVPHRRVERGVQTCVKPKALSSCLYTAASRRVTRLQDQVERLQQRNAELEDEHSLARQRFQTRLQQLHESWQDCFDRHQRSWAKQKAQAEDTWTNDKSQLVAKIAQLTQILAGQPSKELMEDAAVQAGSASGKSRSSQTPRLSTPRPDKKSSDGIWDLLRTQSLPSDSQDWLDALENNETSLTEFGHAAAEYASQVADSSLTKEEGVTAASSFARAAALYAQGMSQPAPALAASCLSSTASDASSFSEDTAFSFFVPLHEECEQGMGEAEKAPKPDQSWWEEFGEWESASTVSPLPQIPLVGMANATQPRLVVGDQIVSLPMRGAGAAWSYDSFPQLSNLIQRSVSEDEEFAYSPGALGPLPDWGLSRQARSQLTRPRLALEPITPAFAESTFNPFGEEADNEDIWRSLCQPAARVVVNPKQSDCKRAFEGSEEGLHADPKVQKARFPSPSSSPWGPQGPEGVSAETPILTCLKIPSTPSNPWGLRDFAPPVMNISFPQRGNTNVTYTPVEVFQMQPTSPAHVGAPTKLDGNFFSASTGFPVTFSDDCTDDSLPLVEVMDMSAGDLVSVGGPRGCAWDGTASTTQQTQHSTPSFPRSSLEEQFAADLNADSMLQRNMAATADLSGDSSAQPNQGGVTEQASQTGVDVPSGQSMQSRQSTGSNGSLLGMHSVGQKRYLATLDELAGLLPQSCRMAARFSTKLPPLNHDPVLPPLPEGFVLPPEVHPVVGSFSFTKAKTVTTGSQTAASWSASAQPTAAEVTCDGQVQEEARAGSGKWLHLKQGPPARKPRQSRDLLDCAAANMNMTAQDLLAPTPVTDLLKDVMSFSHCGLAVQEDPLPAFTTRLADSGFMTCQLAQILAPIRIASNTTMSTDSSPSTPPKVWRLSTPSAVAPAAPAVVDPAFEASLEAAAESLLAEIGIDCSSQLISRVNSEAHSEFELISRPASDAETTVTNEELYGSHRLGPAVQLAKSCSALPDLAASESGLFYSPTQHSAAPTSAILASTAFDHEEGVCTMSEAMTESTISLEDVTLEVGYDSGMTIQDDPTTAAVYLATTNNGQATSYDDVQQWGAHSDAESASDDGSMGSEASIVSASSFVGDVMEEAQGEGPAADEWEMI